MIPLNIKNCELFENLNQAEQEKNYLKLLTHYAIRIMQWTNGIFQINYHDWAENKITMYVSRTSKYAHITQAFSTIINGNPSSDLIDLALKDTYSLYNEIDLEYSQEWDCADSARKKEIQENILMPHMLFIRFLEKYKREKL